MAEFRDITITDTNVEVGSGLYCKLRFTLSNMPPSGWEKEFVHQYQTSGFSLSDHPIKIEGSQIVLGTPEDTVDSGIRRKIEQDVDNTNAAYRKELERTDRQRTNEKEQQQREAVDRRQREAELKRKLLHGDE